MYKPESVEQTVVEFKQTITDGRVLINGKPYNQLDPDERAFFALSVNKKKTEFEENEKGKPIRRWSRNTKSIYQNP